MCAISIMRISKRVLPTPHRNTILHFFFAEQENGNAAWRLHPDPVTGMRILAPFL
jgi:hypothetical protein